MLFKLSIPPGTMAGTSTENDMGSTFPEKMISPVKASLEFPDIFSNSKVILTNPPSASLLLPFSLWTVIFEIERSKLADCMTVLIWPWINPPLLA